MVRSMVDNLDIIRRSLTERIVVFDESATGVPDTSSVLVLGASDLDYSSGYIIVQVTGTSDAVIDVAGVVNGVEVSEQSAVTVVAGGIAVFDLSRSYPGVRVYAKSGVAGATTDVRVILYARRD